MHDNPTDTVGRISRSPFTAIDRSSWVSWASFVVGVELARSHGLGAELKAGGPGLMIVGFAVAAFFVLVVLIQRHMRLSLLANTFGQPQQLVTSGWFRYSRNPIYLAFLIPLTSLAYYSPQAAATAIALYLSTMTIFVISREEQVLERTFGEAYLAYKASVPRWLLWI